MVWKTPVGFFHGMENIQESFPQYGKLLAAGRVWPISLWDLSGLCRTIRARSERFPRRGKTASAGFQEFINS
jgi:hypothetical protein